MESLLDARDRASIQEIRLGLPSDRAAAFDEAPYLERLRALPAHILLQLRRAGEAGDWPALLKWLADDRQQAFNPDRRRDTATYAAIRELRRRPEAAAAVLTAFEQERAKPDARQDASMSWHCLALGSVATPQTLEVLRRELLLVPKGLEGFYTAQDYGRYQEALSKSLSPPALILSLLEAGDEGERVLADVLQTRPDLTRQVDAARGPLESRPEPMPALPPLPAGTALPMTYIDLLDPTYRFDASTPDAAVRTLFAAARLGLREDYDRVAAGGEKADWLFGEMHDHLKQGKTTVEVQGVSTQGDDAAAVRVLFLQPESGDREGADFHVRREADGWRFVRFEERRELRHRRGEASAPEIR